MKSVHIVKRWLLLALIAAASLLPMNNAQAAAPESWKSTGFSIDANGMRLREVLRDFGRVYGVSISSSIDDSVRLKGRFKADTGTEFLERLGQAYKFNWFVDNATLHIVSRTDNISLRLQIGEDAVQDSKAALTGLGLFDPRFGWGELPDEGIVIVSGPRKYVEMARDILLPDEKKAALKEKQVMLFRLKYASATDRTINTRGKTEVIPGVKTILTGLLFGQSAAPRQDDTMRDFDASSNKRSRRPDNGKGGSREVARNGVSNSIFGTGGDREERGVETAGSDYSRSSKSKSGDNEDHTKPRVEANPSLNAIMIYDKLSKRAMYQTLIDQLDVEPQQIEIEALIIDIDRSKLSQLGVEWGFNSGNTSTTINGNKGQSAGSDLPIPGSTLLISNLARFYVRLQALQGTGDAQVLATPTVLTLDNVAAVLDLSQTAYVPLTGERVADLADVTAGTMLRVIPRIIHTGLDTQVHMEVDIEDGALDTSGTNVNATRSTISTQAIVEQQQTLMIGGYHSDSINKDRQKVPGFGDIPLFGNLFKSNSDSYRTRERLFLITPRLVGGPAARAAKQAEIHRALQRDVATAKDGHARLKDDVVPVKEAQENVKVPAPTRAPVEEIQGSTTTTAVPPVAAEPVKANTMTMSTALTQPPAEERSASVKSRRKCARPKGTPLLPA